MSLTSTPVDRQPWPDLPVLEKHHLTRVAQACAATSLARNCSPSPRPSHQRRSLAMRDDPTSSIAEQTDGVQDHDGVRPSWSLCVAVPHGGRRDRALRCASEATRCDGDLGVGLGRRSCASPASLQLPLYAPCEVFDDAVVDHRHVARAVGVGVGDGGGAVGGPARVSDPLIPLDGLGGDSLDQVAQLALGPPGDQALSGGDGDAGGVVAAILQLPQPVDHQGHDLPMSYVTDDPAHSRRPPSPPQDAARARGECTS